MEQFSRRRQYIQQTNSRLVEMQTGYAFHIKHELIDFKNCTRKDLSERSKGSNPHDRVERRSIHILLG